MGFNFEKFAEAATVNMQRMAETGNVPISKKTQTIIDICGYSAGAGISYCANEVITNMVVKIVPPGAKLGTKLIFKVGELAVKACLDGAIFVGTTKTADYVKAGIAIGKTLKTTAKEMKENGDESAESAAI